MYTRMSFQLPRERRKNGLFVYRFGLILAKFEDQAKSQKMTQSP